MQHLGALHERVHLALGEHAHVRLEAAVIDALPARQVSRELRQRLAVRVKNDVHGALGDVEHGRVRHKVVADEDAEQHKVVNRALEVKVRHLRHAHLRVEVLAQDPARVLCGAAGSSWVGAKGGEKSGWGAHPM